MPLFVLLFSWPGVSRTDTFRARSEGDAVHVRCACSVRVRTNMDSMTQPALVTSYCFWSFTLDNSLSFSTSIEVRGHTIVMSVTSILWT